MYFDLGLGIEVLLPFLSLCPILKVTLKCRVGCSQGLWKQSHTLIYAKLIYSGIEMIWGRTEESSYPGELHI